MTELWVKDKFGQYRDVILGYDDNVRPHFFFKSEILKKSDKDMFLDQATN